MKTCCPHPDPQGKLAPRRYCLAVCYCGRCAHYEPLPPRRYIPQPPPRQDWR